MHKLAPVMPKRTTQKAKSVAVPDRQYASVSVRKIDNGYIISKSTDGPGGYKSSESFSPTKPKIDIPVTAKAKR